MSRLIPKTSIIAALALALGFGALHCTAATISAGGWDITPGAGTTLSDVSFDSSTDTVLIQGASVTVTSATALSISFTQTAASAAPTVQLNTASIENLTGSNWTGFNFTLNGAAQFAGVGNVFIPPLSYGLTSTVNLNPDHTVLMYQGTQPAGTTSSWGGTTSTDDLVIDASPTDPVPFVSFTMDEAPAGVPSGAQTVSAPSGASLGLAGLAALAIFSLARKALPATA